MLLACGCLCTLAGVAKVSVRACRGPVLTERASSVWVLDSVHKCVLETPVFAYQNSGPMWVSVESGPGSGGQVGCSWRCVNTLESPVGHSKLLCL